MKKNKFVKLIEHILVALPLLYVGAVALYTQLNENAKDSFTNADYEQEKVFLDNPYTDDLIYYMCPNDFTIDSAFNLYVSEFSIVDRGTIDNSKVYNIGLYTSYRLNFNTTKNIDLYIDNGTSGWLWYTNLNSSTLAFEISFKVDTYANDTIDWSLFYVYRETTHNYLDNALPYAMGEFNKLGFNKIPFTQFFVNIFHNGETNVYIDFVNNYLNYMLFVECCYFVPMIFYWFIHLGEYVVDNFTRKGDKL